VIRYYRYSIAVHLVFFAMIFLSPWIWRYRGPVMIIDGFDWEGGGGGGSGAGPKPGVKPNQMGQVVPAPQNIPVPQKPAPVQKAEKAEEAWKIDKKNKPVPVAQPKMPTPSVPVGEKTQEEKTNIVSRGVKDQTKVGEGGFDYGDGKGKGPGVGIGIGPGEGAGSGGGVGFGFGSYLGILRRRIWQEWTQSPIYGVNQTCVVGLTVTRGGDITNIKLETSSGNSFYDNVAIRAVRNSSPMPPLPSGFPNSEQRFRISFRLTE
jgi:TonB family protein